MGCSIQKKRKEYQAILSQQQKSIPQETQQYSSSPKNENLIIETPSQINLRAQRLKQVRNIIINGYSNSPKIKNNRKQSGQI
ncbi:unnamed protein product [Paramecium sonneborni]|uniref:Uncharacterized protein n=1 Tax=Paramecium sonneborni TaxID=65129 RepID=A0A8S1P3Z7_9CILI|nr:unnamed protein product [Paramecium sonneborni]